MKFIALILFALTITSCCKNKQIGTIQFSESDLSVNPYIGSETIQFSDDSSNLITYGNGNRSIFMEEFPECDGGCCDYYLVESSDNTYFESAFLLSNLQITITNQFDRFNGIQNSPIISFACTYYQVFTLPGISSSPERFHADTMFYTKAMGVIGLKFNDGNLWALHN